jgi:hypothetical protein
VTGWSVNASVELACVSDLDLINISLAGFTFTTWLDVIVGDAFVTRKLDVKPSIFNKEMFCETYGTWIEYIGGLTERENVSLDVLALNTEVIVIGMAKLSNI